MAWAKVLIALQRRYEEKIALDVRQRLMDLRYPPDVALCLQDADSLLPRRLRAVKSDA